MILIKLLIFLVMAGFLTTAKAVDLMTAYNNCLAYATAYGPSQTGCKPKAGNTDTSGGFVTNPGGYYTGGGFLYITGCTSPLVRSSTTGLCAASPCQSGITKSLSVSRPAGQTIFYSGVGPTVSDSGCGFTCSASSATNSINSTTGVTPVRLMAMMHLAML